MHHILLESLQRLRVRLEQDERCIGMYLWGSMADHTADEWSDVDVAAVFRDEDYRSVSDEMRALCEAACGPILVWLPEGEREKSVNYAFLFEAEERVHLYDFSIFSATLIGQSVWLQPDTILFDKTGLLASAVRPTRRGGFNPGGLRQQIDNYWVYTYLNGKYYARRDTFKMLYVQSVIFQTHMRVLNALHPEVAWIWWARDIHRLPPDAQQEMLVYFGAVQPDEIGRALAQEMDQFSRDARAACSRWDVEYPDALEHGVRMHLRVMDVTPPEL